MGKKSPSVVPPPPDFPAWRTSAPTRKKKSANGRLRRAELSEVLVERSALGGREGNGEGECRERAPNGEAAEAMRQGRSREKQRPVLSRADTLDHAADGELKSPELLPK